MEVTLPAGLTVDALWAIARTDAAVFHLEPRAASLEEAFLHAIGGGAMTEDRVHAIGYQRIASGGRRASAVWPIARTLVALAPSGAPRSWPSCSAWGWWSAMESGWRSSSSAPGFAAELAVQPGGWRLRDAIGNVQEVLSSYLRSSSTSPPRHRGGGRQDHRRRPARWRLRAVLRSRP
ncbi:MAG: hypothetical protein R3F43_31440 [bacterium]